MSRFAEPVFVAAGRRTPFGRGGGALAAYDTVSLSVPVVQAMAEQGIRNCAERCDTEVSVVGQTPSRTLVCEVTYDFQPLLGMALDTMTLSANQVVRMEWQRR